MAPLVAMMSANAGVGSTVFASVLMAMTTRVYGQTDQDTCTPTVEIEISVPYDCPYNNFVDGQCMTPRQIADKLVQALFVDQDVEATLALLADDYIQHNPYVPTGTAPIPGVVPLFTQTGLEIEVHRTLAEGNLVAYHSTYTNAGVFGANGTTPLIGFDVFRVENGTLFACIH